MQRRPVLALEGVAVAQALRAGEHIGRDDLVEEPRELGIGEADLVERLELLAEVALQRLAVANVRSIGVFERHELLDQLGFDFLFFGRVRVHVMLPSLRGGTAVERSLGAPKKRYPCLAALCSSHSSSCCQIL